MDKASFSIANYYFDKIIVDYELKSDDTYDISIVPTGFFDPDTKEYELAFDFKAFTGEDVESPFLYIHCVGVFVFENVDKLEDIPAFFYKNSIALLFPYLRAFISTVTIQLNRSPLVLPTLNLSSLEPILKEKTSLKS
ncbi:MAG: hypothetical protein WBG71_03370 [Leeuwenhoekiella sp.]